jgi:hypothetical protein
LSYRGYVSLQNQLSNARCLWSQKTAILWVLWLATGADSAQAGQLTFISGCGYIDSVVEGACRQTAAIQAFSFLNWIIREYLVSPSNVLALNLSSHVLHHLHSRFDDYCGVSQAHRRLEIFCR